MLIIRPKDQARSNIANELLEPAAHEPEELGILVSLEAPVLPEPESVPEPEPVLPEPIVPEPVVPEPDPATPAITEPAIEPAIDVPSADALPVLDDIEPRFEDQLVEPPEPLNDVISSPVVDPVIASSYEDRLVAWLRKHKRYPKLALRRGIEGECVIRIIVDRSGRVRLSALESGSRNNMLDREALAMVDRANPFPAPPGEVPGETLEYLIPVRFDLQ